MNQRKWALIAVVAFALPPASCHLFSSTIPCTFDRDCPSDAVCDVDTCAPVDGNEGEGGREGEGAHEGEGAGEGEGQPASCIDDSGCALSEACHDNLCASRCNGDADCAAQKYCAAVGFFPQVLLCLDGCRIDDAGNDNCGNNICSFGSHRCVTPQNGPQQPLGECAADSECNPAGNVHCFVFSGDDRGYCTDRCSQFCEDSFDATCCNTSGLPQCVISECAETCHEQDCPGPSCCPFSGFSRCVGTVCQP